MTDQETVNLDKQAEIDSATKKLVQAYEQAYVQFLNVLGKLPVDPNSRSLANQFFDTASLWIVNGIKRAIANSFNTPEPTPPEPEIHQADVQPAVDDVDAA